MCRTRSETKTLVFSRRGSNGTNAKKCRCESYECVANETKHDAWVTNLHNSHCGCFPLFYIWQPLSNQLLFLQICTHCTKASNFTTTTNALPTIRMACDCLQIWCELLQICCEYAFLTNSRSILLSQGEKKHITKGDSNPGLLANRRLL